MEELKRFSRSGCASTETLAEAERSRILAALEQTKGIVSGPNGAALRLGLPRTTLMSRMQRLGIMQRKTVLHIGGSTE